MANKDHDPQQLNNQIISAYETLHAFQLLWEKEEPSFSSILSKMIAKLLKSYCFVEFVDISRQTKDHDPQQLNNQILSAYETLPAFQVLWDKEMS